MAEPDMTNSTVLLGPEWLVPQGEVTEAAGISHIWLFSAVLELLG